MRYVYDNSADNPKNPHHPPRTVVYGPDSTNEMAELWLQALPGDPGELPALREAVNRKAWADRIAGWRHLIELDSADAWAHARLAAVYDARGQTHLAFEHYRRATEIDPGLEDAHFGLAVILEQRGETREALHHYREAARAFPNHAAAHNNAGNLLFYEGRTEEAERHYRLAIDADTERTESYVNLGNLLRDRGRAQEALGQYRKAVETAPALPDVHMNLAFNLILLGEPDEAMEHLREVARLAPQTAEPHLSAAWLLATHPDVSARRPDLALTLVEAVRKGAQDDHPLLLDVLAAAHAAAGRFERAAAIARDAVRAASEAGEPDLARLIQGRLELYLDGRPFVSELPGG